MWCRGVEEVSGEGRREGEGGEWEMWCRGIGGVGKKTEKEEEEPKKWWERRNWNRSKDVK